MKNFYFKFFALTLFAFIFSTTGSKACIDYIPTPPPLTVKIDSSWTKFEMTVHNLQIFAGAPGDFCTCGLVSYEPIFDFIYYVAFVDSGTTNPINGFDVWNPNASATSAWSAQIPFSTWNGFVAAVINNMTPNTPVELIIKADLPAGYTAFWQVDSTLSVSGLGADEWDNANDTLAFTHNSITSFGATSYELVSPAYFTSIENIETSITVNIFPNPGDGKFYISIPNINAEKEIEIFNIMGEIIYSIKTFTHKTEIDLRKENKGIYFIRIRNNNNMIATKKIIISD